MGIIFGSFANWTSKYMAFNVGIHIRQIWGFLWYSENTILRNDEGRTEGPAFVNISSSIHNWFATRFNLPSLMISPVRTILLSGPIIGSSFCSWFNWDQNERICIWTEDSFSSKKFSNSPLLAWTDIDLSRERASALVFNRSGRYCIEYSYSSSSETHLANIQRGSLVRRMCTRGLWSKLRMNSFPTK